MSSILGKKEGTLGYVPRCYYRSNERWNSSDSEYVRVLTTLRASAKALPLGVNPAVFIDSMENKRDDQNGREWYYILCML